MCDLRSGLAGLVESWARVGICDVITDVAALQVLVVCTANVCRSPLAAASMDVVLQRDAPLDLAVMVHSAGIDADPGVQRCELALDLALVPWTNGEVRMVTERDLDAAALIVTMERSQRAVAARMAPRCRPRLFTLTQAVLLAEHVGRQVVDGESVEGAPPFPRRASERLTWLVAEMDAARGLLAGMGEEMLDTVDVHGDVHHRDGLERVRETSTTLAHWMARVTSV